MSTRPKRWPRFSLRSVVICLTVLAIGFGILAMRVQRFREDSRTLEELTQRGFQGITRPAGWIWTKLAGADAVYVTSLDLMRHPGGIYPTAKDVALISRFPTLQTLLLAGPEVTDATMETVAQLRELTSLSLAHTCVTDSGIAMLADHPALSELGVNCNMDTAVVEHCVGSGITDESLGHISRIPNLARVYLTSDQLTGRGLRELRSLDQLYDLELTGNRLGVAGIREIGEIRGLEELHLAGRQISDECLETLGSLPRLKSLNVADTPISIVALRAFVDARPDIGVNPALRWMSEDPPVVSSDVVSESIAEWRNRRRSPENAAKRKGSRLTIHWDAEADLLRINGTADDDEVFVGVAAFGGVDYIAVWGNADGLDAPVWHGKGHGADCANINTILIDVGSGNDIVNLTALRSGPLAPWNGLKNSTRPLVVFGGSGDDLLIGSRFKDFLDPGDGADVVHAGEEDVVGEISSETAEDPAS